MTTTPGFIPRSPNVPGPRPVCDGKRCPRCGTVLMCQALDLGVDRHHPQWSDRAAGNGPRYVDGPTSWCPNAANHQPWMPAAYFDELSEVTPEQWDRAGAIVPRLDGPSTRRRLTSLYRSPRAENARVGRSTSAAD